MNLTFSSLFTTIFYSSLLILLVYFVLKKENLIRKIGVRTVILCVMLCILKLMLPCEFFFSHNINLTFVYPKIYQFMNKPLELSSGQMLFPTDIFCFVWFIGIIFCLIRYLTDHIRMSFYIKNLEIIEDNRFYSLLNQIMKQKKVHINFRIVLSEAIVSPCIFGIFQPYIVLPKRMDIDDQNLYFIIKHEIVHYYNGDLFLKFVLSLLKIVYWWNPLIYLLYNQLVRLLEINADRTVTHNWPDSQKLNYLHCLVKSAKEHLTVSCSDEFLSFQSGHSSMISQRVKILLEDIEAPTKPSLPKSAFLLFLSVFLFLIPVFTTFEAWYVETEIRDETIIINSKNAYFLNTGSGTFDLYIDNNYAGTVTEIFDPTIPIIEKKIQE